MSTRALTLTPVDNNSLTSSLRYQQLIQNSESLDLNTTNFTAGITPKLYTFGDGVVRLAGTVVATATTAANSILSNLPSWCVPIQDQWFPVTVTRSGALIVNAVKVNIGGDSIDSITVGTRGSYATLPTVSAGSPGIGAVLVLHMRAISSTIVDAGTDYASGDTVTFSGGTGTASIVSVASTKVISAAVNAAGTLYVPTEILTAVGGTSSPAATFTVATTKVVSATIAAAGSGGTDGTQTVTGTTGTGTKFEASVTITAGEITAVLSISVAGSYTVNPTAIGNEPVTGAGLTGAELNVVMGVDTVTLTTAGVYTVNSSSFTTTASGSGIGATLDTAVYGINAVTINTAGSYTALPSNPVSQASTSGSGTGATFTPLWGLDKIDVTDGGYNFTSSSTVTISGGGGTGGGTASIVLTSGINAVLMDEPNEDDIISLDAVNFMVDSYKGQS